jgi:predicted alpha/beta-hydrolase family hydrolase
MRHPFLGRMAGALADRGIGTLRYQFPYIEKKQKRPDPPAVAEATVRAAVRAAAEAAPGVPLIAGGKSFGGRMTSGAAAREPLPGVKGIAFLGFPLHPPARPGTERADHLDAVTVPMLFLQGTRDDFAQLDLLKPVVGRLGARATLHLIDGGDHSFKVPKSGGRTEADVMRELAGAIADWLPF